MNDNNFSELFEKFNIDKNSISPDMINNLMGMLNSNSNNEQVENNTTSTNNIDFETIMKIKTIMEKMNSNQNDPRSNLLLSLKPYLKESKRSKVDQYVQLLNISKILEAFPFSSGGDSNKC